MDLVVAVTSRANPPASRKAAKEWGRVLAKSLVHNSSKGTGAAQEGVLTALRAPFVSLHTTLKYCRWTV